jgi:tRNA pseudouridine55 synthase
MGMNGLLVIDKPAGITSHDVVARLRRIAGEKSIGHLGTLDPMATGVLPLMMGKYTRLTQFFSTAEKSYEGIIRFGFSTDTYDADGETQEADRSAEAAATLTLERVREAAARFHGEIDQMPPVFSAKKIAGTPAYKLARKGEAPELKAVKIHISSFEIVALDGAEVAFRMSISAGGYVRSVAYELGRDLMFGAHLSRLRRTQAGPFTLQQAHTIGELEPLSEKREALEALCVHPRTLLPEMPAVTGDPVALGRLRNGAQANLPEFSRVEMVKVFAGQRDLVAIAKRVAGTLFQPVVVMG